MQPKEPNKPPGTTNVLVASGTLGLPVSDPLFAVNQKSPIFRRVLRVFYWPSSPWGSQSVTLYLRRTKEPYITQGIVNSCGPVSPWCSQSVTLDLELNRHPYVHHKKPYIPQGIAHVHTYGEYTCIEWAPKAHIHIRSIYIYSESLGASR